MLTLYQIALNNTYRHKKLFSTARSPNRYVTLHFRDRRDAALLRYKNRIKITVMCEQKPKSYPV